MSLRAMLWALGQDIDPGEKLSLIALANFADDEGHAWPSQATIAELTNQGLRTVNRHFQRLQVASLIVRLAGQRRKKRGRYGQNVWLLNIFGDASLIDPNKLAEKIVKRGSGAREAKSAYVRNAKSAHGGNARLAPTERQSGLPSCIDDPVSDPVRNEPDAREIAQPVNNDRRAKLVSSSNGSGRQPSLERTESQRKAHELVDENFAEFKQVYPSRGDAANPWAPARDVFRKLVSKGVDPSAIVDGAHGYARAISNSGKSGTEYVCQAVNFLKQRRWEEYQAERSNARLGSTASRPTVQCSPNCPAEAAAKWQRFSDAASRQRGPSWVKSWLQPLLYDGKRLVAPSRFIASQVNIDIGHDLRNAGFGEVFDPPPTTAESRPQ